MRKILLIGLFSLLVSPSFAARPIAAWDVVPYQRVNGTFKVGVVAFHDKAVKVEFSINGRKFGKAVEAISLNERTNVEEYFFSFPAGKFSERLGDREFTIGANVIVDGESSYQLSPLTIYANGRGTLGSKNVVWVDSESGNEFASGEKNYPVKTLARAVKLAGDGGTIYLNKGSYSIKLLGGGVDRKYWTKITTAPGVDSNLVKVYGGRPGTDKLHFKGLNFICDYDVGEYGSIVFGEGGKTSAWFEDCTFTNLKGKAAGEAYPFSNKLVAYVTGGTTSEMMFGPDAVLLRNHNIKSVVTKALPSDNALVVNCNIEDIGSSDATSSDFITASAIAPNWFENLIVYGLKTSNLSCRIFTLRRVRNSAFVKLCFDDVSVQGAYSSVADFIENVLFFNVSLPNQELKFALSNDGRGDFKPVNVIMKNCNLGIVKGCVSYDGSNGFDLRDSKYKSIIK